MAGSQLIISLQDRDVLSLFINLVVVSLKHQPRRYTDYRPVPQILLLKCHSRQPVKSLVNYHPHLVVWTSDQLKTRKNSHPGAETGYPQ